MISHIQYKSTTVSHHILNIVPIARRYKCFVTFVVTRAFPFQVKFIHLLCVLCSYQLRNELELLSELYHRLLEYRHLSWRPTLENRVRSHWVYQNVQVPFLVQVVHSVEVQLNGFFLLLWVGFVDFGLGRNNLKNRFLLGLQVLKQRSIGMIINVLTRV